jgi:PAS domain S-box-containing protein
LNGTINAISDAIVALDENGTIVFMNRSAEKMFALEEKSAKEKLFLQSALQ